MQSEGSDKIEKWRVMTPENYENEFMMHKGHLLRGFTFKHVFRS